MRESGTKHTDGMDRVHGCDGVRDLLRRYGVPGKIVGQLWKKGVGKSAFMRGDFFEYGPLEGARLRRLQDKWKSRPENFLHDRQPRHARAAEKLRIFYGRHGLASRADSAGGLIDSFSHDPAGLCKDLPEKFPSQAHEFGFLFEWASACQRENKRHLHLAKELERYHENHNILMEHNAVDVIKSFIDDPRALYNELVDKRPETRPDLKWLLSWAESVESSWGERLEVSSAVRIEENKKYADREIQIIRTELRCLEDRILDTAEDEAERRGALRELERENDDIRKTLRSVKVVKTKEFSTQTDLEPADTPEMFRFYAEQQQAVTEMQRTLSKKRDIVKALKKKIEERKQNAFQSKTAADIFSAQLFDVSSLSPTPTLAGSTRSRKTVRISEPSVRSSRSLDLPPPLVYEHGEKKKSRRKKTRSVPPPSPFPLPYHYPHFTPVPSGHSHSRDPFFHGRL
eukprot:TRINITY_DN11690_c0_g1_i2.p1 TRINITY_DN11690_c0_g1~~TRINITY_DN11690_c0_g1_i2.p1  ORF type:complete len:457 (+),score=45.19 TRINITY_DN11690_c0_g1_i2:49-1419(+)